MPMTNRPHTASNWFDAGGLAYARFRPEYPPELAAYLAAAAPDAALAADVGCGSGQLTRLLAQHFNAVVGLDPSGDQIANAPPHNRITYLKACAEQLPLGNNSVGLMTAAQAAHWFNLPAFYQEARRVAVPGGILALISYGVLSLDAALDSRFQTFYRDEIGPYWPAERALVDSGYATLDFPFKELSPPVLTIERHWNLAGFLGYLSTWSAVRRAREAGRDDVLASFAQDISRAWGDEHALRPVIWPLNIRIGHLR